jgi:hypothetical protein
MWTVMYSYLAGAPDVIPDDGTPGALECALQMFADAKKTRIDRPAIGALHFERSTDQIDVYFNRGNRIVRFMTLMAA